jgi:hypothetical protein
MVLWAWRLGTAVGTVMTVTIIKLVVHDTDVPAIWTPVVLGTMLGGLLGSLYGVRAQFNPGHTFDFWRDVVLNVAIGVVGGTLLGSLVAVHAATQFPTVPSPLFEDIGPVVMVWTVIGAIVGAVAGVVIDRVRVRRDRDKGTATVEGPA